KPDGDLCRHASRSGKRVRHGDCSVTPRESDQKKPCLRNLWVIDPSERAGSSVRKSANPKAGVTQVRRFLNARSWFCRTAPQCSQDCQILEPSERTILEGHIVTP